jgi:hypothetical protein
MMTTSLIWIDFFLYNKVTEKKDDDSTREFIEMYNQPCTVIDQIIDRLSAWAMKSLNSDLTPSSSSPSTDD